MARTPWKSALNQQSEGQQRGWETLKIMRQLSLSSSLQFLSQHPSPPDSIRFKVNYLSHQGKGVILSWSPLAPCPMANFLFLTILNCDEMFRLPGGLIEGFDHIWFIVVTPGLSQCLRLGRSSVFTTRICVFLFCMYIPIKSMFT